MAPTPSATTLRQSYPTPEDFLADLRTTLLDDSDALVDWQIRYSRLPEISNSKFCFRVRLPDVAGTDGVAGTDMVSGEPPDTVPDGEVEGPPTCVEDTQTSPPPPDNPSGPPTCVEDPIPEIEGPPTCVEDMEDFCPITYLAYRKGLGCYAVDKVHLAATRLGLSPTQAEVLVAIADSALPKNLLYLTLQAIFVAKEDQHIHQDHLRVLAEARAVLEGDEVPVGS